MTRAYDDRSPRLKGYGRVACIVLACGGLLACRGDAVRGSPPVAEPAPESVAAAPVTSTESVVAASAPKPAPHVETVPVAGDLPAFVLRGGQGTARMIFLHGFCSHGPEFAESFEHAAAERGSLIAIQADRLCDDGTSRRWTNTREQLDARIEAAIRASGDDTALRDLVMIGYSEGAVLAEMLAHLNPERYSRVILIGAPRKPLEFRLRHSRATVMMAGARDRQDHLKAGRRELDAAGIPSAFFELPGAKHGQMGPDAERVMADAFAFLFTHARGELR